MTLPEPTLAEVVRRLDGISSEIAGIRAELTTTYVRQDVHRVVHDGITAAMNAKADRETVEEVRKEVSAIQADMAAHEDFRRKIMLAVVGLGLTNGAALIVAVVQHLAGGGS